MSGKRWHHQKPDTFLSKRRRVWWNFQEMFTKTATVWNLFDGKQRKNTTLCPKGKPEADPRISLRLFQTGLNPVTLQFETHEIAVNLTGKWRLRPSAHWEAVSAPLWAQTSVTHTQFTLFNQTNVSRLYFFLCVNFSPSHSCCSSLYQNLSVTSDPSPPAACAAADKQMLVVVLCQMISKTSFKLSLVESLTHRMWDSGGEGSEFSVREVVF